MTKQLADELEDFLKHKLEPEHAFILFVSETPKSHAGVITNYSPEMVIETMKQLGKSTYVKGPKKT